MTQNPSGRFPTDPSAAKRVALVISLALLSGVVALGVGLTALVPRDGSAAKPDAFGSLPIPADILSTVLAGFLCLVSIAFARRMHDRTGTPPEQVRNALSSHIYSMVTAEASAVLGFAFVLFTGSWDHFLAFVLGAALLLLGVVRAVYVFNRFEAAAKSAP